jgi:hypothetical protein
MDKIVWRCDISNDMITHLDDEQRKTFLKTLSDAVNKLGAEYKVGREYENGVLREGWHN